MEKNDTYHMNNSKNRFFLLCGAISAVIFTLSWIIQEIFKTGYNPIMVPVSSLAIGELGWIQSVTFLITGLTLILFAYGLEKIRKKEGFSKWTVIFLVIGAIGLIGAGCFTTDPINGFPPGTGETTIQTSLIGILHQLFSVLLFIGLPIAMILFSKHFLNIKNKKWWIYSIVSAILFIIFMIILKVASEPSLGLLKLFGLIQRIILIIGFLWVTLLSCYYFNKI
ncbi:MAG: DUF998 domain-containing protein [Methanobacteriaceae archaeon]|jgi:hypothetical membrane protein|nr:DUF998 domain-containing protein [Candidatus Methanorudis spinitermitis]